jgi:hypothetical protein
MSFLAVCGETGFLLDFGRHREYSHSVAAKQCNTESTLSYRILRNLKKIRIKCLFENPKPCVLHRRNRKCVWLGETPQICCHYCVNKWWDCFLFLVLCGIQVGVMK